MKKLNISDYRGKKYAVQVKTVEDCNLCWSMFHNRLPSSTDSIQKHLNLNDEVVVYCDNDGWDLKSDAVRNNYTILQLSEFLEENKEKEGQFIRGQYYHITNSMELHWLVKWREHCLVIENKILVSKDFHWENHKDFTILNITEEQIDHLNQCVVANKHVEYTPKKEEVVPEYVECIKEDFNIQVGKIYKIELEKGFSYKGTDGDVYFINNKPYFQIDFKPSTKEAYDAQFKLYYDTKTPLLIFKIGSWYSNPLHDKMDYGKISLIEECKMAGGNGYYLRITFDRIIKNNVESYIITNQANTNYDREMVEVKYEDIKPKSTELTSFPEEGKLFTDITGFNSTEIETYLKANGRQYVEKYPKYENVLVWGRTTYWYTSNLSNSKKPEYTIDQLSKFFKPERKDKYIQILKDNPYFSNTTKNCYYKILHEDEFNIYFQNDLNSKAGFSKSNEDICYSLMNDSFKLPKQEENKVMNTDLIEDCKRRYPIGTEVYSLIKPYEGVITHELAYTILKNEVWFKSEENGINLKVYGNGDYAKIKTPIINEEELLEEAKRRYPIGTTYKCPFTNREHTITKTDRYQATPSGPIVFPSNESTVRYLYLTSTNVWAEIISLPETKEKVKQDMKYDDNQWYKVGDTGWYVKGYLYRYSLDSWKEAITYDKKYTNSDPINMGNIGYYTYIPLTDLSEIQSFLPKEHVDKVKQFVKGAWYTCSCNQNLYRFYNLNGKYFENDAVINPTNNLHGNAKVGLTESLKKDSLAEFFSPTKLADMSVVNKYLNKKDIVTLVKGKYYSSMCVDIPFWFKVDSATETKINVSGFRSANKPWIDNLSKNWNISDNKNIKEVTESEAKGMFFLKDLELVSNTSSSNLENIFNQDWLTEDPYAKTPRQKYPLTPEESIPSNNLKSPKVIPIWIDKKKSNTVSPKQPVYLTVKTNSKIKI